MVRLDRLINVLGGLGVRLETTPATRARELRSVAVHAPCDPAAGGEDVVLAVGVGAEQAAELLRGTDAVAVLFRASRLDPQALAVARERDVAVLLADPAVSWGQLAGVVYGVVLEGRETEAGRGPTDLFALADALAETVGGPVTVEDHRSGVLAYSSRQHGADPVRAETILGRRVPDEIRRELADRGVFRHLEVSDEPLFVAPVGRGVTSGRVVVAVRAGRELLGSIWVETPTPLDDARPALRDAARTAAAHMLRARASADLERQVESDLVIGLVEGHEDPVAALSRLGLPGPRYRVVAVQAGGADRNAAALLAFERATTGFGWTRPGRSALFANTVYTVVPYEDADRARRWVRALGREMPEDTSLLAGIGGPADPLHLVDSRREADESLALHAEHPDRPVAVVYDEAWHELLLRQMRQAASLRRVPDRGPVADLRRHDRAHGTRHVETLRAWLECQGDLAATASRLEVHPNTVRYRMRRMAEVTALDLDDPESRLAMIIALAVSGPLV
ncbi:PucR family transcriptional regulator [Saccharopolyspora rosea]|uniref:PucR family transcriptional regulator n=1 Tax=Saccharopolyspora rosea TaxID=524884 RepID=A0ABW3G2D2_9PSEU|nr:PucR family transcriptional regulator [Saccharopolyspora rosea]